MDNKYAGLVAGEDLSDEQFHAVRMGTDPFEVMKFTDVDGAQCPIGILLNKPKLGQGCEIAGPGSLQVKATAGGTINEGNWVAPNASGELVVDVQEAAPSAASNWLLGIALQGAADGDVFYMAVFTPLKLGA